jgi:hypothetical protein
LQGFAAAQGLHGLHGLQAAAAQGLHGLHGLQGLQAAAQGLQGLHAAAVCNRGTAHFRLPAPPPAAQGLQGLQAAAQGLHGLQAAAQGLHGLQAAAAQGLHGLQGFAAAQGLHGLQAAYAGAPVNWPVTTMPPAATPAKTMSGITVVDRSFVLLHRIGPLPVSLASERVEPSLAITGPYSSAGLRLR